MFYTEEALILYIVVGAELSGEGKMFLNERKFTNLLTYYHRRRYNAIILIVSLICAFILILASLAKAEDYSNEEIANAIYLAEGGRKASSPFGILSVKCEGYDACRRICLNTIRNNRRRYADYGYKDYDTYLEFLWHRYAPPTEHPLNKFWLKNVLYFLEKDYKEIPDGQDFCQKCKDLVKLVIVGVLLVLDESGWLKDSDNKSWYCYKKNILNEATGEWEWGCVGWQKRSKR